MSDMQGRLLVVDDNEMNRDMLSRRLERKGFDVMVAVDGRQGVDVAKAERPDLVLMDIQLPGMDGLEATKRIRDLEEGKEIPIVALTSYAMTGDREKVLSVGCTGYIEKPINADTFISEIEKYF